MKEIYRYRLIDDGDKLEQELLKRWQAPNNFRKIIFFIRSRHLFFHKGVDTLKQKIIVLYHAIFFSFNEKRINSLSGPGQAQRRRGAPAENQIHQGLKTQQVGQNPTWQIQKSAAGRSPVDTTTTYCSRASLVQILAFSLTLESQEVSNALRSETSNCSRTCSRRSASASSTAKRRSATSYT